MVNAIAERLAGAIAEQYNCSQPPIDIEALAANLGVDEVIDKPLLEDGRLERYGGSTKILVRSDISASRRRFTIAHELAHLLLTDSTSNLVATRHIVGEDAEERFCEDFAAAILLPSWWIQEVAGNRRRILHTLRVVAGRSNTSLAASCVRLNKVLGWQHTLLQWSQRDSTWQFQWAAGLPNSFEGRIRSADRTPQILDTLDGRGDIKVKLPLRINGEVREVPAELSVRHGSALALAVLV